MCIIVSRQIRWGQFSVWEIKLRVPRFRKHQIRQRNVRLWQLLCYYFERTATRESTDTGGAVDAEKDFICDALPCALIGMNATQMTECARRWYTTSYTSCNFDWYAMLYHQLIFMPMSIFRQQSSCAYMCIHVAFTWTFRSCINGARDCLCSWLNLNLCHA